MKFRKPDRNEIELIKECITHFKGHFETDKFSLFADKFNKVFIYNGTPANLNLSNLRALSIGLNIGKLARNTFVPTREFVDLINPAARIFEIETMLEGANFMKGWDIYHGTNPECDKEMYKIYIGEKLNLEENTLIAIKYKGMTLGVGKFTTGKIINKISKREKLH
ncbi:hypothetical protein MSIBF_A2510008 [groundwater metagenome]|uniref:rRNA small subunit methyltransferase F RNA-binding PUA-like domain-containing protein n=1 Tax=groundwater metagenome TaxID=717931 RepID=A0A098EAR2_9ZZZZ